MDFTDAKPFLFEGRRGVLATIRSSGVPQMSNIVYGVIDEAIWVSVTDDRAKTANVRSDPRAVLHVTSDDFWRYVVVEADVTLTPVARDPEDEVVAELKRLYWAVSGDHDDWDQYARAMVDDRRLMMKLTPIHTYGNLGWLVPLRSPLSGSLGAGGASLTAVCRLLGLAASLRRILCFARPVRVSLRSTLISSLAAVGQIAATARVRAKPRVRRAK